MKMFRSEQERHSCRIEQVKINMRYTAYEKTDKRREIEIGEYQTDYVHERVVQYTSVVLPFLSEKTTHSGNTGRYYGGTVNVDAIEEYACDKWREVFGTDYHVNVQPHSGSQANFAAYKAVLEPGDTILLKLDTSEGEGKEKLVFERKEGHAKEEPVEIG